MADALKSITPNIAPVGGLNPQAPGRAIDKGGPSFKDALGALAGPGPAAAPGGAAPGAIKFSGHAIERMQRRGINYTPSEMQSIERAIDKAQAKGGKETLVLTDNSAMIVSVNNRTVVTVMDKQQLKENVFTNIDSTVMI